MEILEKLKQLEENLKLLEELKKEFKVEDIVLNRRYEWELRYGLFESIQVIIDISCKIVNLFNLGKPENYRECLELLGRFGYLKKEHIKRYISMIGLRNLLVHGYATIDAEKLYSFLDNINDFKNFIDEISANIKI